MSRILVVDDEPDLEIVIKQRFRKEIKEGKYSFSFARNGLEALDRIKEDTRIDIILTDINMPEMDGLTLLSHINTMKLDLKAIVVSAYGDFDKIRKAMNYGAFDFLVKPIDFLDMELTIEKTLEVVRKLKEAEKLKRENIENRIKLETEKEQRKLAEKMRESLKEMTSSLNVVEVSQILLDKLSTVVSFDHALIYLKDKESFKLVAHSESIYDDKYNVLFLDKEIEEKILLNLCDKRLIKIVKADSEFFYNLSLSEKVNSIFVVPVLYQRKTIGLVVIENNDIERYSENQMEIIETFVEQAAIAIENALLFEKVEYLASTDSLTGINNRRHFFEVASAEFKRSLRYKAHLSAIMIDVDKFKEVNDKYGHAAGDKILKFLAEIISNVIRETDVAGRYGGEEFVVLLTETDLNNAILVAERIREGVKSGSIAIIEGKPLGITISLGVAELLGEMKNIDELIALADKALYVAKANGRDRTEALNLK